LRLVGLLRKCGRTGRKRQKARNNQGANPDGQGAKLDWQNARPGLRLDRQSRATRKKGCNHGG